MSCPAFKFRWMPEAFQPVACRSEALAPLLAVTLLFMLVLSSCSTTPAWHPEAPLVTLHDVHGLFGGDELLIDQSGQLWLRSVSNAQRESRHYLQLDGQARRSLITAIQTSGILRYRETPFSPGPCTTRMSINIEMPGKRKVEAAMWDHHDENYKFPDFMNFYRYLVKLCAQARQTKPYFTGEHDWKRSLP